MPAKGECYLRRVEDLVARMRESSQVMQTDALDATYRALGDPSRRAMLQHLAHARSLTVSELAAPLKIAQPTVLKHLGVLERANLVCRQKSSRTMTEILGPAALAEARAWLQHTEAGFVSGGHSGMNLMVSSQSEQSLVAAR